MTSMTLFFAALTFVGGMLVAAQGPIYARLSESLNQNYLLAVFLAFATASAVTGLLAAFAGSFRDMSVGTLGQAPVWVWLGGLFGAVHVVISMQSIPVLGVTLFVVVVVTGNLVGAAIYDHLGAMGLEVRSFSGGKAVGLLLVVMDVAVVARA